MADGPNEDEKAFWSGPSGQGWIDYEDTLDTLFQPVSDLILGAAGTSEGERVLDIGCGTGAHSLSAAKRVGPGGHVLATDISEPLLSRTQGRAESEGLTIGVQLADAQVFAFDRAAFDLVTSRFGVMFFADPAAAFANMAVALKSGGRMVFGTWAPVRDNPWWYLPSGVTKELLGDLPKAEPNSPGPMGLASVDFVAGELAKANVGVFDIEPMDVDLAHPGGADVVAHMMVTVGSAGRALRLFEADETQSQAVEAGLVKALTPFDGDHGLSLPAKINLIRVNIV